MQGIEKNIIDSCGHFSFEANKNSKDKDTFIYQEIYKLTKIKSYIKRVRLFLVVFP